MIGYSLVGPFESNILYVREDLIYKFYQFQLEYDTKNQQARDNLQRIEPLKDDIEDAKDMFHNGDHQAAIELLTKAIEVSELELLFSFSSDYSNLKSIY